jgi:hypothetical protein
MDMRWTPLRLIGLVGVWVALVGGCASSGTGGSQVSRPPEPSKGPSYVQVDWPDDKEGVAALFDRLPGGFPDYTLDYEGEPGDQGFRRYFGGAEDDVRVYADPDPENPLAPLGVVLVYTGVPAWCIDATYSADFDSLYGIGADTELGDLEAARTALDQFQVEFEQAASAEPVGGIPWIECTTTYDVWNERVLDLDERSYLAAWTDQGWTYTIDATSAAARSAGIEAMVRAAEESLSDPTAE